MINLLQDKVAFITGCNVEIGKAAALRIAKAGAKVVVVARSEDSGEATVKEITDTGGKASFVKKVVIIGASSGIGLAVAKMAAKLDAYVVMSSRTLDTGVWSNQSDLERDDLLQWAKRSLPVQHIGQAEELAQAILGLMTNSYITGVVLPVDGGLTVI